MKTVKIVIIVKNYIIINFIFLIKMNKRKLLKLFKSKKLDALVDSNIFIFFVIIVCIIFVIVYI
jgi:hypothetical protein